MTHTLDDESPLQNGAQTTRRVRILTRMLGSILLGFLLIVSGPADAQPPLAPPERPQKTTFYANELNQVRDLAQAHDEIPVILRLTVDYSPEGQLGTAQIQTQREAIHSAQDNVLTALETTGFRLNRRYRTLPSLALTLSPQAVDALENHPLVERVHLDVLNRPVLDQSVPHIQADQLHDQGDEGQNIMTVIIDTGIDRDHDAFTGRVAAEACFARGEEDQGDCPNGETEMIGAGAGVPLLVDGEPHSHGTYVGGIAAGAATTATTPDLSDGVAPGADVGSIQVFSEITDSDSCFPAPAPCALAFSSDVLAGLDHVNESIVDDHDVASVNMSLGGGEHDEPCDDNPMKDPIDSLRASDVATVISTGNDGWTDSIASPACISSSVPVGSTALDNDDEDLSGFSNQHPDLVGLVAPGSNIVTAEPENGTASQSGTSMAAPHVAGAWALLQQATSDVHGVGAIEQSLLQSGEEVEDDRDGAPPDATYRSIRLADALGVLANEGSPSPEMDEFIIAPNPYRPNDGSDSTGNEEDQGIEFCNLPEDFEINVYTLMGEEVISFSERGFTDPCFDEWLPVEDRFGDPVASGYYLVNVEDRQTGSSDQRKLAIIR